MRYTHFGALSDLEQSVSALKICLAGVTGPKRFVFYNPLSMSLEARFRRLGQQEDIQLSIEACRAFLAESGIHDPMIQMIVFWRLSKALVAYHEATGDGEVLDKAAGVGRDAVRLCGADHPLLAVILALQGTILRQRFVVHGSEEDLKAAWTLACAAVATHEASKGEDQNMMDSVAAKGMCALVMWEDGGKVEDLSAAIALFRAVAEERHETHPDRAEALFRLGDALKRRYQLEEGEDDLIEAVCLCRDALEAQTDTRHPRYPFWLQVLLRVC